MRLIRHYYVIQKCILITENGLPPGLWIWKIVYNISYVMVGEMINQIICYIIGIMSQQTEIIPINTFEIYSIKFDITWSVKLTWNLGTQISLIAYYGRCKKSCILLPLFSLFYYGRPFCTQSFPCRYIYTIL